MVDALARPTATLRSKLLRRIPAPQTTSGFAEASHKTIAFKTVSGELDVFRQPILRSGSESHTDRSLSFIGNRVTLFNCRINNCCCSRNRISGCVECGVRRLVNVERNSFSIA